MEILDDIKSQAIVLGKRHARIESSIQNWTREAGHIEQMLMLLREALECTRKQEQELQQQLRMTARR